MQEHYFECDLLTQWTLLDKCVGQLCWMEGQTQRGAASWVAGHTEAGPMLSAAREWHCWRCLRLKMAAWLQGLGTGKQGTATWHKAVSFLYVHGKSLYVCGTAEVTGVRRQRYPIILFLLEGAACHRFICSTGNLC